jgi:hypothetical protein
VDHTVVAVALTSSKMAVPTELILREQASSSEDIFKASGYQLTP